MGALARLTSRIRGLFHGSRHGARNDMTPGHESADLDEIVHERAVREAQLRRGGDTGGNTPNSSSYF